MKKKLQALFCFVFVLFFTAGCLNTKQGKNSSFSSSLSPAETAGLAAEAPSPAQEEERQLHEKQEPDDSEKFTEESFAAFMKEQAAEESEDLSDRIYLYTMEDLLSAYLPSFPYWVRLWGDDSKVALDSLLEKWPTEAVRRINDQYCYIVYDSDTGIRLFVFARMADWSVPGAAEKYYIIGQAVYVSQMLSYSDFSGIEVGDSYAEVKAVDPEVVALYEEIALEENWSSIHILRDGILKITYCPITEEGYTHDAEEAVITAIEYSPDYLLSTIVGADENGEILYEDIPYKVNPLDYPGKS